MKRLALIGAALLVTSLGVRMSTPGSASTVHRPHCDDNATTCAEVFKSIGHNGEYVGHEEPAVLFYSNAAGSGNSMSYRMTLPTEPPTLPTQDGTGGTYNFMLHPTFWLGMVLCTGQSDPNPG